jgi:hypothetical protein
MGNCCSGSGLKGDCTPNDNKFDLLAVLGFVKRSEKVTEADEAPIKQKPMERSSEDLFKEEVKGIESNNFTVKVKFY